MDPTHERLERNYMPRVGIDLGLVVQHQLATRDRAAQFGNQPQSLRIEFVDTGVVANDCGAGRLRRIECQVCSPE